MILQTEIYLYIYIYKHIVFKLIAEFIIKSITIPRFYTIIQHFSLFDIQTKQAFLKKCIIKGKKNPIQ